jgi:hypothetical protein
MLKKWLIGRVVIETKFWLRRVWYRGRRCHCYGGLGGLVVVAAFDNTINGMALGGSFGLFA